jgi:hypothetical protein
MSMDEACSASYTATGTPSQAQGNMFGQKLSSLREAGIY